MSFIVIEGDNGTGKDTLAKQMQEKLGYRIITEEPNIKKMNIKAKTLIGEMRVKEFLEYGKKCSDIVSNSKENIILVRYWISTLAAAYADNIYDFNKILKLKEETCTKFCNPDVIFCLWCNFNDRINRIKERNSPDFDDITTERALRYRWILHKLQQNLEIKWININTTNKSIEEVYDEVYNYIKSI